MSSKQNPFPKERFKLGKLTLEEQAFIRGNVGSMTVPEIAKKLHRRPVVIERFLEEKTRAGVHTNETLHILRNSDEYKLLDKQLTPKELKIFEKKYCEWVGQFQGDILFSEQNQIFNTIKQDIMMGNIYAQKRNMEETLSELDNQIKEIRGDDTLDDIERREKLTSLRKDKTNLYGIYNAIINQLHEQNKMYNLMIKDLNACRAQRKPKDEVTKNNVRSLLKIMSDDRQRVKMGEDAELEKLSAESEGEKFITPTEYLDGSVSYPFMSGKE